MANEVTKVLLIEDNPHIFKSIMLRSKRELNNFYQLEHRNTLVEGLRRVSQGGINLIVLDLNLPDSKGIETFFELQRHVGAIPIIVLSSLEDEEIAVEAVKGGAQDYLFKSDIKHNVLFRSIRYAIERKKMEQELWKLSVTDSMTGLFNQRYFFEQIHNEVNRAVRSKSMLCLILLDIDDFKFYNDTRGHLAGDDILRRVGFIIKESIRESMDLAFRYGGDEFAVILPSTGFHEAMLIADRIKEKIEKLVQEIKITYGVSSIDKCRLPDEIMARADRALYENKGRNRNDVGFRPADTRDA